MALRSRPRVPTATSGPGRAPASDVRTRHRRPPRPPHERERLRRRYRYRSRHRAALEEELRRRAEALFGKGTTAGRSGAAGESGAVGGGYGGRKDAGDGSALSGTSVSSGAWSELPTSSGGPEAPVPTGRFASAGESEAAVPAGALTGSSMSSLASAWSGVSASAWESRTSEASSSPGASEAALSPGVSEGASSTGGGERRTAGRTVASGAEGPAGLAEGLTRRARVGPALRERMPVWLQTRCGVERRSVLALTALLAVAAALAAQHFWTGRAQTVRAPEVVRAAESHEHREQPGKGEPEAVAPGGTASAGPEIVVDVTGKVRDPGIHRLPAGSRVADALRAAGGVRPGTKIDSLNRARFLVDGEQVIVGAGPGGGSAGATDASGATGAAGTSGASGQTPTAPVTLSTATVDQLDTLPGVGPVLAQHIVDYRTQHGGFRSVDELREVTGIGERRFADLRNLVRP